MIKTLVSIVFCDYANEWKDELTAVNSTSLGFVWNGTQYFYMTNQMGDVVSITDAQGKRIISTLNLIKQALKVSFNF